MRKMTRTITKGLLFGATLCGLALLDPGEAKADPMTHDGFYLHLDVGLGYFNTSSDSDLIDESISGVSVPSSLLLGGTVGPVAIGGGFMWHFVPSPSLEAGGNSVETGDLDISLTMFGIGMFADIYPDPKSGLHFLPFIGYGVESVSVEGRDGGNDPGGLLLSLGVGYDFWMSDEWSIGPMLRFDYASLGYEVAGESISYPTTAISALATFTYH